MRLFFFFVLLSAGFMQLFRGVPRMLVHFEVSLPSFAFMEGMVHGVWPAGEVSPIRDGLEQDGEQNGKGVGGTRTKRAPDGTMRRVWQGLFF